MANQSEKSVTNFLRNLIIPTHYRRFFRHDQELLKEAREDMLLAVTLVAAVTFQAGVTPPGGVWQDNKEGHKAGHAIYSSQSAPYLLFLICNTLAFSSSIYLLLSLTFGFPFYLEVLIATFSMSGTYAAAIFAVTPYEPTPFRLIALVVALPVILRPAIDLLSWMFRKEERLLENQTNGV